MNKAVWFDSEEQAQAVADELRRSLVMAWATPVSIVDVDQLDALFGEPDDTRLGACSSATQVGVCRISILNRSDHERRLQNGVWKWVKDSHDHLDTLIHEIIHAFHYENRQDEHQEIVINRLVPLVRAAYLSNKGKP